MDKLNRRIESILMCSCSPFQYAAEYGNKAAVEYFLQKLPPSEWEESVVKAAGIVTKNEAGMKRFQFQKLFLFPFSNSNVLFLLFY